jgi:hypothetical protein
MEERVRICDGCSAVVGWYARFCEACGAVQPERTRSDPTAGNTTSEASGGASRSQGEVSGHAPDVLAVATSVEEPPEARTRARQLFSAQLRLMHRTSEQAEALCADIRAVRTDVLRSSSVRSSAERREKLAALSERLLSAEGAWDELQRVYNRESEAAEEEWQEAAEGAQVDAYLTPAEEDAIGGEFAALTRRFEAAESSLRETARELSLARREAVSRVFGLPARSNGVFAAVCTLAVALTGLSAAMMYERSGDGGLFAAAPAFAAVVLLALVAYRRG